MNYHPAEFARTGFNLLHEIAINFKKNKKNSEELLTLTANYDKKIDRLLKERVNWTRKDYIQKNIQIYVKGSIFSLISCLVLLVFLENLKLNIPSLSIVFSIYIFISIIGGSVYYYYKSPKWLTSKEKENSVILGLFNSAEFLESYYYALKGQYETKDLRENKKKEKEKKADESKQQEEEKQKKQLKVVEEKKRSQKQAKKSVKHTVSSAGKQENSIENSSKQVELKKAEKAKMNKRFWGHSENEREQRRNIFSQRFLSKVSQLKGGDDARTKILLIEPDAEIQAAFNTALHDTFILMVAKKVKDGIGIASAEKPRAIILDIDFHINEQFHALKAIKKHPDIHEIPIIIFTEDTGIETLVEARNLSAVDYWEKMYDEEDKLILNKQNTIDKINFVLSHNHINLYRLLDRRIKKREKEQRNLIEKQHRKNIKILVASKDYLLLTYLQEELFKFGLTVVAINNPQSIFSNVISEKPKLIIIDDNISEESIFNICKMLNIRARLLKIMLILTRDMDLKQNLKTKELKILKKFSRPFNQGEILENILNHLQIKQTRIN